LSQSESGSSRSRRSSAASAPRSASRRARFGRCPPNPPRTAPRTTSPSAVATHASPRSNSVRPSSQKPHDREDEPGGDEDDADPGQAEEERDLGRPLPRPCRREFHGRNGHAREEQDHTDQVQEQRDLVQAPKFVRMRPGTAGATIPPWADFEY
jgi:hypothetical protein